MRDAEQYGILLDKDASDTGAARLDLPPGTPPETVADALTAIFAAEEDIDSVVISVDDQLVGVSTRQRIDRLVGEATRGIGDGDGATLPGASTGYRVFLFRCLTCGEEERRIHLDPRSAPSCSNGHGDLERVR